MLQGVLQYNQIVALYWFLKHGQIRLKLSDYRKEVACLH